MNEQLENNNNNHDDDIDNNFEEINTNIKDGIKYEDDDDDDNNIKLRARNNNNKNRTSKRIFLDDYKDRKTKNMIREENNLKEDILNLYI